MHLKLLQQVPLRAGLGIAFGVIQAITSVGASFSAVSIE